jgi:hypothetical protein
MGSLDRRLARLEEQVGRVSENEEERVRSEALRRVTTEDLETLAEYLRRAVEEGGEPTPEEEEAILRYEELREEVRNEFRAPSQ